MGTGAFELTTAELRAVVKFAADCAQGLLPEFEAVAPADSRPREAIAAARAFVDGADRSNRQRTAAFAAHRAARSVIAEPARLAALACGDAAAAAYLHPIAKATQVGHILRAAACAARVAELRAEGAGTDVVSAIVDRAAPPLPEILGRYPPAPRGETRVSQLMSAIDSAIRDRAQAHPDSVVVEMGIDAPVEVVWQFLTARRDAWWPEMRFDAAVGSSLVETWIEDGVQATATGRVTRCDEPQLLAFEWTEGSWSSPLDVVIRLTAQGSSTWAALTEAGFSRAQTSPSLPDEHAQGWLYHLARLKRASEGDADRTVTRAPGGPQ